MVDDQCVGRFSMRANQIPSECLKGFFGELGFMLAGI
jgi:hypothetical protein